MHLGGVSGTDVVSSVLGAGDGGEGGGGLSVVVPKPLVWAEAEDAAAVAEAG